MSRDERVNALAPIKGLSLHGGPGWGRVGRDARGTVEKERGLKQEKVCKMDVRFTDSGINYILYTP